MMILFMATFFYINQPVVSMREHPTHSASVVSQTIFGEEVGVEKEQAGWTYITTPDGYNGWVESNTVAQTELPYDTSTTISRLAAHVYAVKDTEYGPVKTLPYGSKVHIDNASDTRWAKVSLPDGSEGYIQNGDIALEASLRDKADLVAFSQRFLGLPYTWGGRSSFGYDCSGFIQMLYSQIGIDLQRDSKQQILDERFLTVDLSNLEPGDLIFFGKADKRIGHVGMYIGDDKFIHTSARECRPWLRISSLSDPEWAGHSDAYYPHRVGRQFKKTHLFHSAREENTPPFDELILSWNADRPATGDYEIYVSVKIDSDWSPWHLYASWGADGQSSFLSSIDTFDLPQGQKATGFQIKTVPAEGIRSLHVYTNGTKVTEAQQNISYTIPVALSVAGFSQMALDHERANALCSPTSTAAVVHYLTNNPQINALDFAKKVWDRGCDIFGNWPFNVAQAAAELGPSWQCWVERLDGFDEIYRRLHQGTPVVVSIRGPLPGSALPYAQGHLIAVVGYDPEQQQVLCMDPAFPSDKETRVSYDLSDFIQAWNRRGRIAYIFAKKPID
jgi:cell wall-associated NlpC family hydrolase